MVLVEAMEEEVEMEEEVAMEVVVAEAVEEELVELVEWEV